MGFADPYHKHPLKRIYSTPEGAKCFRCELPVTDSSYGCPRCNHFVHDMCSELPKTVHHPIHRKHPLFLLAPPLSSNAANTNLCAECHNLCEGYVYHCSTCQFSLHLKCFLTFKYENHEHPLKFFNWGIHNDINQSSSCGPCGYDMEGLGFACLSCNFHIHLGCISLPQTVKHHHVHELSLNHKFPDECDQVYCDLCEDKHGELNRRLSYYYCKRCDYIAHVLCVVQLEEETATIKHFSHEHPLTLNRKFHCSTNSCQLCHDIVSVKPYYSCDQCFYIIHKSCAEFPTLVKHPLHQEHSLTLNHPASSRDESMLHCTDCDYTLDQVGALKFTHPYQRRLWFSNDGGVFRCNACGELGEGFRMKTMAVNDPFDLHLECFALPGNIHFECHLDHPLFLLSSAMSTTSHYCNVCNNEVDPELWMYCCEDCDFVAHLNCAASDLLSMLRSYIKNRPDFCAIVQCEQTSFSKNGSQPICSRLKNYATAPFHFPRPVLFHVQSLYKQIEDYGHRGENYDATASIESEQNNGVDCPNCRFPTLQQDSSTVLDEQSLDEIHCPVCTILIFPPFAHCAQCKSSFHKSCAMLPHQHTSKCGHTFELVATDRSTLSHCNLCKTAIAGFAYVCETCVIYLDVRCACAAPYLLLKNFKSTPRVDSYLITANCIACGSPVKAGTSYFRVLHDGLQLHVSIHIECALLPHTVKHRIHKHPLELASDLEYLDDEYICDVCEKELNPMLWAYRCSDSCGIRATSHVSCVINSKKKSHFRYEEECRDMNEGERLEVEARRNGTSNSYNWRNS